jgi:hypothetical protein
VRDYKYAMTAESASTMLAESANAVNAGCASDARASKMTECQNYNLMRGGENEIQDGLFEPKNEIKCSDVRTFSAEKSQEKAVSISKTDITISVLEMVSEIGLDEATLRRMLEMKRKGFDVNSLLNEQLDKREKEIEEEKEKIAADKKAKNVKPPSRYIPAKIKKILHKEHGTKCSISTCNKPAKAFRHTDRFAMSQRHNPYFIAPLCEEHHRIAHCVDVKYVHHIKYAEYARPYEHASAVM